MKTFTIAVIAGDGVGTEVIPQAKRVLEKIAKKHDVTFSFQDFDWGADHYFRWGRMMPAGAIDLLQPCDAILLGAVGHPEIPDHTTLNGLLLPIRRAFDQYANVRPAYLYPGVHSPLARPKGGDIDFVVVRENTEGEYAQVGGFVYQHAARRGRHPDLGVHAARHRAHRALRVRAGGEAQQEEARHLDHQVQRAGLQHGAVGPLLRGSGGGVSAHRDRIAAGGCRGHELHPPAGELRRGGGLQPVRRYPERHFGDHRRQHGPRGQRQSRSAAPLPLDVRAGARVGAGYRGQGRGQSAGHDSERRHDARSSRHDATPPANWKPPSPRCWRRARCARPTSAARAARRK